MLITIPMKSLASTSLVPERRVTLQRAKDKVANLQKEQVAVRQAFKPPLSDKKRIQLSKKQSVMQKRMMRLKSMVQVENKKLMIAQRIDTLQNRMNNVTDKAQKKSIRAAINKLREQMTTLKPLKRKGSKKMAKRKVFAKAET